MKIAVVIPFCKKDIEKTIRLLNWISDLGGCKNNDCILMAATDTYGVSVTPDGRDSFKSVRQYSPSIELSNENHPMGPNLLFETACKVMAQGKTPWLWLEPDAVPIRKGWLEEIETEYAASSKMGMPILGDVTELKDPKFPVRIISGVAVYPANALDIYKTLQLNRKVAWDIQFADKVAPMACKSRLIQNLINHNPPPVKLTDVRKGVALFHPCKDGSLIKKLSNHPSKSKTFYHSGDLGDLIYALPLIKKLGGGRLILGPYIPSAKRIHATRAVLDRNQFDWIAPLLKAQSYVESVEYSDVDPHADYDLNLFRETWFNPNRKSKTLAESYFEHFNAGPFNHLDAWLNVDYYPLPRMVSIHRSERYQNDSFPWREVVGMYAGRMNFVGTIDEAKDFTKTFGHAPRFEKYENALHMAKVINGCELFIGNQSLPNAIALGLRKPVIQEVCEGTPDCVLIRPENRYLGINPIILEPILKKLVSKDYVENGKIVLGPCERAYGIGDMLTITPCAKQLGDNAILKLPQKLSHFGPLFNGICPWRVCEDFPVWPGNSNRELQSVYKLRHLELNVTDPIPFIRLTSQERAWGEEQALRHNLTHDCIAFVPTCAKGWEQSKMRPIEYWEDFFENETRAVLQFGRKDYPLLKGAVRMPFYGLRELASVYSAIKNIVCVDTGDLHMMLAVGGSCFVVCPDDGENYCYSEWQYQSDRVEYTGFNEAKEKYNKKEMKC